MALKEAILISMALREMALNTIGGEGESFEAQVKSFENGNSDRPSSVLGCPVICASAPSFLQRRTRTAAAAANGGLRMEARRSIWHTTLAAAEDG